MVPPHVTEAQELQGDRSRLLRLGKWLFTNRTVLALPPALALLLIPASRTLQPGLVTAIGVAIVVTGEALRIWAVRHIGVISRTRSDRLGPLISNGPFALVRNPLYLGNIILWVGFAVSAHLVWMVPLLLAVLGFEYHTIVRWEEQLLTTRRGDEYRHYAGRVPRWIPAFIRPVRSDASPAPCSWRATLHSERGTLIAIGVGLFLLWAKAHWILRIGN
jgi:protein-S-isoprenylcysteine O-methyltransferase Ste14